VVEQSGRGAVGHDVGKKAMAVTGIVLVGFVIAHMLGNLKSRLRVIVMKRI